MVYVPGPVLDEGTLVWSDHAGNTSPALAGRRIYGAFQISPDGKRLAATVSDLTLQIWIYEFDGSRPPTRLTHEGQSWAPVWHADGDRVVFTSLRDDRLVLLSKPADGSGEAEELLPEGWSGGLLNKPRMVSPDGNVLLFDAGHAGTGTSKGMDRDI